jgi:tetratricopeptide (TPR) repeat protein
MAIDGVCHDPVRAFRLYSASKVKAIPSMKARFLILALLVLALLVLIPSFVPPSVFAQEVVESEPPEEEPFPENLWEQPIVRYFAYISAGLVLLMIVLKVFGALWSLISTKSKDKASFITRRYILKEAGKCLKLQEHEKAGDLYLSIGETDEACNAFMQGKLYHKAAVLYERDGKPAFAAVAYEKADMSERAAECWVLAEDLKRAEENYLRAGKKLPLAKMFEKAGRYKRAAKYFRELNMPLKLGECLERSKQYRKAAKVMEDLFFLKLSSLPDGMLSKYKEDLNQLSDKIKQLRQNVDDLEGLLAFYVRAGMYRQAGGLCESLGDMKRAAEFYHKCGDGEKAATIYESVGEKKKAFLIRAELLLKEKKEEFAADCFFKAGEHWRAAEIYERIGKFSRAAEIFESMGALSQAAWLYSQSGNLEKAAHFFEKTGEFESAAYAYESLDNMEKLAEVCERGKDYFRAGEAYYRLGKKNEAIAVLQKISSEDPSFQEACSLLGILFYEKEIPRLALKMFHEAAADKEPCSTNLEIFYYLARTYETLGETGEARSIYEKILTVDFHYQDVAERIERLSVGETASPVPLAPKFRLTPADSSSSEFRPRDTVTATLIRSSSEAPDLQDGSEETGGGRSLEDLESLLLNKGRYKILEELGRGGMGIIYKVKDTLLDRIVAYKVLSRHLRDHSAAVQNFLREAKSAARLNHPNIVTIYDFGEADGKYFMTLEFVSGKNLKQFFAGRDLNYDEILDIVREVCGGLAYAHDSAVIHRDIKPSNIMISDMDQKVKLLDFGLAKILEDVSQTASGVLGTPWYMSPEQVLGAAVDQRSDLYSLGVTLFEILTRRLPFKGRDFGYHHLHTVPPEPGSIVSDTPRILNDMVMRCMEKKPKERYQTAREIMEEIDAYRKRRR